LLPFPNLGYTIPPPFSPPVRNPPSGGAHEVKNRAPRCRWLWAYQLQIWFFRLCFLGPKRSPLRYAPWAEAPTPFLGWEPTPFGTRGTRFPSPRDVPWHPIKPPSPQNPGIKGPPPFTPRFPLRLGAGRRPTRPPPPPANCAFTHKHHPVFAEKEPFWPVLSP